MLGIFLQLSESSPPLVVSVPILSIRIKKLSGLYMVSIDIFTIQNYFTILMQELG